MALPDFSLDFVLDTDASGDGLGVVLSQVSNGEEKALAYTSRALSRTERKYCATKGERCLPWFGLLDISGHTFMGKSSPCEQTTIL